MALIFLEALAAGLILVFIVWWTMFSGRPKEPPASDQGASPLPDSDAAPHKDAATTGEELGQQR